MKDWKMHIEFFILMITMLGGFYTIDSKIERQIFATHERIDRTNDRIDHQCERTDKLYEMFVDLLKENKKS